MKAMFLNLTLIFGLLVHGSSANASEDKALRKTVKVLLNAIRYEKDDLAAKQLDFTAMVSGLLEGHWDKLPGADKKYFAEGMEQLIRKISFKAGRDSFKYLDATTFKTAKFEGQRAELPSAVVIDHPIKGRSELKITWVFNQAGGNWKIFDTIILGESTMDGIREDQIEDLLDEGGIGEVKKAMKDKLEELN